MKKQECIPVGCVPAWGVFLPRGVYLPGGVPAGGVYLPGGVPAQVLPPVNRMTDRCKNITLPQTSFAGGNKDSRTQCTHRTSGLQNIFFFAKSRKKNKFIQKDESYIELMKFEIVFVSACVHMTILRFHLPFL